MEEACLGLVCRSGTDFFSLGGGGWSFHDRMSIRKLSQEGDCRLAMSVFFCFCFTHSRTKQHFKVQFPLNDSLTKAG